MNNISRQAKYVNCSTSVQKHSIIGNKLEKLQVLKQEVDINDSYCPTLSTQKNQNPNTGTFSSLNPIVEEKSATVEYQHSRKKKIWNDRLSSSELTTLTTKLLKILDQDSTSKGKDLTPFWTPQSKEISKKLWLPTEIDCVDSVLNCCPESSHNVPMGKSWFSITKKHPQNKNSLMTSFQLSQFSLPDSTVCEATVSKGKSNKPLKTLKIRLFPTEQEKAKIHLLLDQYRWYYNSTLTIVNRHYGIKKIPELFKLNNNVVRDLIRKYRYTEELHGNLLFQDFVYEQDRNETLVPPWWENQVHSRLPRGASDKFTYGLNSALALYRNGHINKFQMKFMSKKKPTEYCHFEDGGFPAFIRKIKSHYWFRTKNGRTKIQFSDINTPKRGIEIIYDKITDRYFLHYPVEKDWFPEQDIRSDSQVKYTCQGDRLISLDPGVRKFLVGYDPSGQSIFIGENAHKQLSTLLFQIDKTTDKNEQSKLWSQLRNLVDELHWKTISFLVENYDIILLPEFRISQMIRKKKLARITKRLLCMFSFYRFKTRLEEKCRTFGKNLIIVDESYTSCTCGVCGTINSLIKGKEVFECPECHVKIDRDVAGSRNVLIKNISLR